MIHLLVKYKQKNVMISLDKTGKNIRVTGDKDALSNEDKSELIENKEALLSFLKEQRSAKIAIPKVQNPPSEIPLTPNQRSIWVHTQMEQDKTLYLIPAYFDFEIDHINPDQFKESLKILVYHNPILSYVFKQRNGIPYQQASEINIDNHFQFSEEQEEGTEAKIRESVSSGFEIDSIPPWKILLFKVGEGKYKCFLKMHHIISDAETIQLFFKKLIDIQRNLKFGQPYSSDEIKYLDYALWLNDKSNFQSSSEYWKSVFTDYIESFVLPSDTLDSASHERKSNFEHVFKRVSIKEIKDYTQKKRITSTSLYSLALGVVLMHKSGCSDFVIGIPSAGRTSSQLSNVLGDFVNTLPFRLNLSLKASVESQLETIQNNLYQALEHQIYPMEFILEDIDYSNTPGSSPLFNILLSVPNNYNLVKKKEIEEVSLVSKYDFSFTFLEYKNELELKVEYDALKFNSETVRKSVECIEEALTNIVQQSIESVSKINIIKEVERTTLLEVFNNTYEDFDRSFSILDAFQRQVKAIPNTIAVSDQEELLTYQELDDRSTRLSNYLIAEYKLERESFVGIKLSRTNDLVVSMLAVLKSGYVYVPIDLNYPKERIEFIQKDSGFEVCIDQNLLDRFTLHYDSISGFYTKPEISPSNLAYIIYTSGSTGVPKGVMIEHGNLSGFLHWCNSEFGVLNYDTVLFTTSICFDLSIFEVFYTLYSGKTIEILEDALKVPECLERKKNVLLNTVPSVVKTLLTQHTSWDSIKVLNMAGETISSFILDKLKGKITEVRNLYGPSEDTTYSTCFKIESFDIALIGRPISNTKVYILNQLQQLVGIGEEGEIFLSGIGLSRGYWNRPELTAKKFIDNPFLEGERLYKTGDIGKWSSNGELHFVGRHDDQLKIRGFRVELGEIEYHLNQFPEIIEAVVIADKNSANETSLIAFYISEEKIDRGKLVEKLSGSIPKYMIPDTFVNVDLIPLTINGKIDKRKLLSIASVKKLSNIYVAPENEIEESLIDIWKEVLEKEKIGVLDNFFELGGHSLKAIQVLTIIENRLNVKLDFNKIFNAQTIRQLALEIENIKWLKEGQEIVGVKKVII